MSFFDINNIAFELNEVVYFLNTPYHFEYKMSWLELVATIAGLLAVWLSAREHISSWGIGLINVVLSSVIFYTLSLYSDVFLQIYFFVTGIYGWWLWSKRKGNTQEKEVTISWLSRQQQIWMVAIILISTLIIGSMVTHLHTWFPIVFPIEASFPYADTLVMTMSIFGNLLLMVKKIESWILWILVDIIAPVLYFQKGILLITFEYVVFLGLACFALVNWLRIYRVSSREY
jgi:nicotinamide mononucleotide transporter